MICQNCIHFKVCKHKTESVYECEDFKENEVNHGKWNENIIGFCNVCMECGLIIERTAIKNKSGKLNYCPNCGAKNESEVDTE